jgi:hypothetical protein
MFPAITLRAYRIQKESEPGNCSLTNLNQQPFPDFAFDID